MDTYVVCYPPLEYTVLRIYLNFVSFRDTILAKFHWNETKH